MSFLSIILLILLGLSSSLFAQESGIDYLMSMEQTRINRTVDDKKLLTPDIENQKIAYRPDEGKWFNLPSVLVEEKDLHVALSTQTEIPQEIYAELIVEKNGKRYHRLFIHPESQHFYKEVIEKNIVTLSTEFEASATSSSRTVRVRKINSPKITFFAKLSLDVELGSVTRTIPSGEVARSVGTSDYLVRKSNDLKGPFKFMPEVVGIIPKKFERGGQIIRLIPPEVLENKSFLIPLFSLYAKKDDETMLEILARKTKLTPTEFVQQHILNPFMQGWTQWVLEGPVTMEAHAQNVLLEVDSHGFPTGKLVHRDMGGFNIDGNSVKFDVEDKKFLPFFKSFGEDYHQAFTQKAKIQSILTYFEGGFLFNIDVELQRIDPGYVKGSIYRQSRETLVKHLIEVTGATPNELGIRGKRSLTFVENLDEFNGVIEKSQEKLKNLVNCNDHLKNH